MSTAGHAGDSGHAGPPPAGFRRLGEEQLHRGSLVTLARASFAAPDGTTFQREIVHHPGAVVVVPVVGEGEASGPAALLVRQFRAAVGDELLELPAGKRDVAGEAPDETARRELEEEVGMRAGRVELLARFYNSPGYCDELSHLFLARDLTACERDPQGVEEAGMTVERWPLEAVASLVADGGIVDAKTIIGLTLARDRLSGG